MAHASPDPLPPCGAPAAHAASWAALPREIIAETLALLPLRTRLCIASLVCTRWRAIVQALPAFLADPSPRQLAAAIEHLPHITGLAGVVPEFSSPSFPAAKTARMLGSLRHLHIRMPPPDPNRPMRSAIRLRADEMCHVTSLVSLTLSPLREPAIGRTLVAANARTLTHLGLLTDDVFLLDALALLAPDEPPALPALRSLSLVLEASPGGRLPPLGAALQRLLTAYSTQLTSLHVGTTMSASHVRAVFAAPYPRLVRAELLVSFDHLAYLDMFLRNATNVRRLGLSLGLQRPSKSLPLRLATQLTCLDMAHYGNTPYLPEEELLAILPSLSHLTTLHYGKLSCLQRLPANAALRNFVLTSEVNETTLGMEFDCPYVTSLALKHHPAPGAASDFVPLLARASDRFPRLRRLHCAAFLNTADATAFGALVRSLERRGVELLHLIDLTQRNRIIYLADPLPLPSGRVLEVRCDTDGEGWFQWRLLGEY